MKQIILHLQLLFIVLSVGHSLTASTFQINIWYGPEQYFGTLGQAQRWINILGNVEGAERVASLTYTLNGDVSKPLTMGGDLHRLAMPGDFNVEIGWSEVAIGKNILRITGQSKNGERVSTVVTIWVEKDKKWPLPYWLDFSKVENLQKAVQVVDGHWRLANDGVRTVQRYYDRVLSIGDTSWENYEATIKLTLHSFTPSEPGPPTYNVTHFGVAMRWRGHHQDGRQPGRKWFPLGAQGELLLRENADSCRWRILFDGRMKEKPPVYTQSRNRVELGEPFYVKTQIVTLPDGRSRYRFKQWNALESEPLNWDIEGFELDDYASGALCLVPHNSEVTIHELRVEPVVATDPIFSARPGPGAIHFSAPIGGIEGSVGDAWQQDFIEPNTQILAVGVNLTPGPVQVVQGMCFKLQHGDEGSLETIFIGNKKGEWQEEFLVPAGSQLVGISGASGWYLDAIQFQFSNGVTSPRYGGKGGDTEFDLRIRPVDRGKSGRIRGFHGRHTAMGIESLGLIFDPGE